MFSEKIKRDKKRTTENRLENTVKKQSQRHVCSQTANLRGFPIREKGIRHVHEHIVKWTEFVEKYGECNVVGNRHQNQRVERNIKSESGSEKESVLYLVLKCRARQSDFG